MSDRQRTLTSADHISTADSGEESPDSAVEIGAVRAGLTRRHTHRFGSIIFAIIDFVVILAPSFVLAGTARQGGLPDSQGDDLMVASALIGAVHGVIVWTRLRDETRHAHRIIDVWISEFDSLVVLALGATMLLVIVLGGFAEQHAVLVNNGWPVIALWTGVQVTAVALSELSGRVVFRWLEPSTRPPPACVRGPGGEPGTRL